ncbi:MAG: MinD/ParA family protein [Candidatus Micrarchaeota archaeon]|nr:MinD/ParA family protein [Candidatus Micrarchaeota archaeon]
MRVSSPKGGVGKSVIATNLGVALQSMGYNVLMIDLDLINPCVGLYLGIPETNLGFLDAVKNPANIKRAIVPHSQTGMRVLPGRMSKTYDLEDYLPSAKQLRVFYQNVLKLDFDFVVVDTQPGIAYKVPLDLYNEAIIVAQPHRASCISAVKLLDKYGKAKLKSSVVINRRRNKNFELDIKEIEDMTEEQIMAELPEDENVPVGVSEGVPCFLFNRRSPFARKIGGLANVISKRIGTEASGRFPNEEKGGLLGFLKKR